MSDKPKAKKGLFSTVLIALLALAAQKMGWLPVGQEKDSGGGTATMEAPEVPGTTTTASTSGSATKESGGSSKPKADSGSSSKPKVEAPKVEAPTGKPSKLEELQEQLESEDLFLGRDEVVDLFAQKAEKVMVTVIAPVVHILPDDNEGSRHQRFLMKIQDDLTVLIAHNIDLAPRVPVEKGDLLKVRGQYEYNEKGGVLHWTHHDPKKWREGGWIELDGKRYE